MNPISIVPNLTSAGIGLAVLLAIVGGSYLAGDVHGSHKAELACVTGAADANARAIKAWQTATSAQLGADKAARREDQERSAAAADQAQAVADRFEQMRIAIVKFPPGGTCKLSPEWVTAFNGAR